MSIGGVTNRADYHPAFLKIKLSETSPGGKPDTAPGTQSLLSTPSEAERNFLEISQKSPLERLRDKILEDMKLSDGDLAQMSADEREAVEAEIARRMKEALQGSTDTGQVIDKSA